MKPTLALALLVASSLAFTGCGSAKKVVSHTESPTVTMLGPVTHTITVLGSRATLRNVPTGARIACKGWMGTGLKVPPGNGPAAAVSAVQGSTSSPAIEMQLSRRNGLLTVSCEKSK